MGQDNADGEVLGPEGAARAVVGVALGVLLGAFIALITPRQRRDPS